MTTNERTYVDLDKVVPMLLQIEDANGWTYDVVAYVVKWVKPTQGGNHTVPRADDGLTGIDRLPQPLMVRKLLVTWWH